MGRKPFVAGVVQFDVVPGDTKRNLALAARGVRSLAKSGTGLVVLPELFSSGLDLANMADHAGNFSKTAEVMAGIARENKVGLIGSVPEPGDGGVYNTSLFLDRDGAEIGRYRKMHLFRPLGEHEAFEAGDEPVVCDSRFGPVGLMICYDLRFPELCRALVLKGARIIAVPAQWPDLRIRHWEVLVQARAVENQVFVMACNRSGIQEDIVFGGRSMIVGPWGKVLARGPGNRGARLRVEIDLSETDSARKAIPCFEQRRSGVY